jgi:hypothetical protein
MDISFEREKNLRASAFTIIICGGLAIFLFLFYWTLPQVTPPDLSEGIEVNLGNSDDGFGDQIPEIAGDPSLIADVVTPQEQNNVPETQTTVNDPIVKDAIDEVPITKPPVAEKKKEIKKTSPVVEDKKAVIKKNTPKVVTTPVKQKTSNPKALFKGGNTNGTGGNGGEKNNNILYQGDGSGKGDKGNPNGNPYSPNYKGNAPSGNSGVSIRSGLQGRRFTSYPSFEDDFNEEARVAVDITVDRKGKVIAATINLKSTSTTNSNIKTIALRKAKQLKLNEGNAEQQTGTIVFDFKLRG